MNQIALDMFVVGFEFAALFLILCGLLFGALALIRQLAGIS